MMPYAVKISLGALHFHADPGLQRRQSSPSWALFFIWSYSTSLLFIQTIIVSFCLPRVLVPSILPSKTVRRSESLFNNDLTNFSVFVGWCSVYSGGAPCRHRKTSTESLNSIRSGTRSQWRSRSNGVMCSYFRAEQTSRAAAFITDYSLSSCLPGRPASDALP